MRHNLPRKEVCIKPGMVQDDGEVGPSVVVRHGDHRQSVSCSGSFADIKPSVAVPRNRLARVLHRAEDACITNAVLPRRSTDTDGDDRAMAVLMVSSAVPVCRTQP
jgi:hypothetical protein